MFSTLHLASPPAFEALVEAAPPLEGVTKGRVGGVIVDTTRDHAVPLVRTTTRYTCPPRVFQPVHHELVKQIGKPFNNGLVEIYTDEYKTMGYHSDQAQDLADDSYIAVLSVYKHPDRPGKRQLDIKKKGTKEYHSIHMSHGSVILFDLATNAQWNHRIVLPAWERNSKCNAWFGITFRLSKTFVFYGTLMPLGKPLRILDDLHPGDIDGEDKSIFYKSRRQENRRTDFVWPDLDFSISPLDLMTPLE